MSYVQVGSDLTDFLYGVGKDIAGQAGNAAGAVSSFTTGVVGGSYLSHKLVPNQCVGFPSGYHRSDIKTKTDAFNWLICGFHACVNAGVASTKAKAQWNTAAKAYYKGYTAADSEGAGLETLMSYIVDADRLADAARAAENAASGKPTPTPPPDPPAPNQDKQKFSAGMTSDNTMLAVGAGALILGLWWWQGKKGKKGGRRSARRSRRR